MGTDQGSGRLEHLTGARCLAALWIVCAHFLPKDPQPILNGAVFRVNVAVCFFVVASGFVTHWSHGTRELSGSRALAQFYLRRLGRVVPTFWFAMAFACYMLTLEGKHWDFWYLFKCFLFVQQWVQWCPNGPSWFVFALLPSWLLYPLTRHVVLNAEKKGGAAGLMMALVLLWAVSFGPAIVLFAFQGGNITMQQHADMCFWPPAQLADFAIGVCTAALVQRSQSLESLPAVGKPCLAHGLVSVAPAAEEAAGGGCTARGSQGGSFGSGVETKARGRLADASLGLVIITVFFLPRPQKTYELHLNGWEPALDHGLTPLFVGFLYGSSVGGYGGLGACLLRHRALVALGSCSFEVYIFQRPVHDMFRLLFDAKSAEVFLAYLLSLWLFAGLYAWYVQEPLDRWLRNASGTWLAFGVQFGEEEYIAVSTSETSEIAGLHGHGSDLK